MPSVPLNLRIGRLVLSRKFLLDRAYTYIIRLLGLIRVKWSIRLLRVCTVPNQFFSVPSFLLKISYSGAQMHLGPLAIYHFTLVTINHRFTTLVLGSIQFTVWLTLIWSKPQISR